MFKPFVAKANVLHHLPSKNTLITKPIIITFVALLISILLFMTLNANDNWGFILPFRGKKLLALLIVGYAIGVSTLLFQTITQNPILTPALLGFDSLYILIQSVLVFVLGAANFANINPLFKFVVEVSLMLLASLLLFNLLLKQQKQDLIRMILVGIIFGVLFRSLSSLIARLIDPEAFFTIQAASFAQFNTVNPNLMLVSALICVATLFFVWLWRYQCDVLMLGRIQAINLGVDYQKLVLRLLIVIAVLVATATAFVGPVTFLGLLVCAITNRVSNNMNHSERLILVSLVAMLCLVLGQVVFEQVLNLAGVLSVVIEFVGGIVFLLMMFTLNKKVS